MKCKMINKLVLMNLTLALLSGCKTDKSQIDDENTQISTVEETAVDTAENDSLERLLEDDVEIDVAVEELENSLIDYSYPYPVDIEPFYDEIESCYYAENFEGEWHSLDSTGPHEGELTIAKQNSDGFYFKGVFLQHHGEYPYYKEDGGPNVGDASGYAHFINDHLAISSNNIDLEGCDDKDIHPEGYAVFYLYNDHLYIRTTGTVGWMGGGVYMDGEYILK